MKVLVINSGSSSIKFQLLDMPQEKIIASGLIEKIGLKNGEIHYNNQDNNFSKTLEIQNHEVGLREAVSLLIDEKIGVLENLNQVEVVGHRVVHGGKDFINTTIINESIKNRIKSLFSLAPLHNPPNFKGIEITEELFKKATQVAVFDTSFHTSIPELAYRYAIPNDYYLKDDIRLYGFHGISHQYVSSKAIEFLNKPKSKIITIHLGNGCSMTAIKNGKSIDHSLGFGPNEGLIMGTRCGDIDSSVIFTLMEKHDLNKDEIANILSKESGMLGISGYSDLREIESLASKGDDNCNLALEMNAYRIKKYIGAYAAILNGLDAIVFTAGIGENSELIRELVCENMDYLGIEIDHDKNKIRSKEIRNLKSENSKVNILVIPTNEELEIAKQSYNLLK